MNVTQIAILIARMTGTCRVAQEYFDRRVHLDALDLGEDVGRARRAQHLGSHGLEERAELLHAAGLADRGEGLVAGPGAATAIEDFGDDERETIRHRREKLEEGEADCDKTPTE